jgi:hypothetical protein
MMRRCAIITISMLLAAGAIAQWRGRGGGRQYEEARTAREVVQHGNETPTWTNRPEFEQDTFTFARIRRDSGGRGGPWWTDAPDSDLNLSYRLQQMTALKVNPDGRFLRLTDKALADYPFIYMVEPGSLYLSEVEVTALRNYLLNGGFLWLDDFWGEEEWENVAYEMKRVFPNREFVELPITNQLYRCVFDITAKRQIPAVDLGTRSQYDPEHRTWERSDAKQVHHRVIFDDKGRLMVFATHNTDNGDGWEWEGDNLFYFREFAEKTAYPLAVNVVFYVMTH